MTTNLPALIELPEPPVPTDCDCRELDGFMLNVERLMASELVAISSHEVVCAAIFLWCRAWKQVPAASLPDDDRVLAAFAKLPIARFKKLKEEILRGFVKCRDNRLYHLVLAAVALAAFQKKKAFRARREKDAERLRQWRANKDETANETRFETRSERSGEGEGEGEGEGSKKERKKENAHALARASSPRFVDFWDLYPHKVGKGAAEVAFTKAAKAATVEDILAGLKRYVAKTDDRPWCNPATWLNQQRWLDQPALPLARAPPNGINGHGNLKDQRRQEWNDATTRLDEAIARRRSAARDGSSPPPDRLLPDRSGE